MCLLASLEQYQMSPEMVERECALVNTDEGKQTIIGISRRKGSKVGKQMLTKSLRETEE